MTNPVVAKNIRTFRTARNLPIPKLAKLSGVPEEQIQLFEQSKSKPKRSDLEKLGLVLGVPAIAFRSSRSLSPTPLPVDFRTKENAMTTMSVAGARVISDSLNKVRFVNLYTRSNREFAPEVSATLRDDPENLGRSLRRSLGIESDFQIESTPSQFLRFLSNSIQLKGVFVFRKPAPISDFRGFTNNQRPFPLIVVNTKDNTTGAQIFTLAHEYVHLVIDKAGVSDPRMHQVSVERFCNKVAAALLAPRALVANYVRKNPHNPSQQAAYLGYFANKLKISLFAAAIRLKELDFVDSDYVSRYVASTERGDKDTQRSGGGVPPGEYDYGAGQIWRYGSRYLSEIGHLLDRGQVTFVDVEKVLGIGEEKIVALIGQASVEQQDLTDKLESIEFTSFSRPYEDYEFDVV